MRDTHIMIIKRMRENKREKKKPTNCQGGMWNNEGSTQVILAKLRGSFAY